MKKTNTPNLGALKLDLAVSLALQSLSADGWMKTWRVCPQCTKCYGKNPKLFWTGAFLVILNHHLHNFTNVKDRKFTFTTFPFPPISHNLYRFCKFTWMLRARSKSSTCRSMSKKIHVTLVRCLSEELEPKQLREDDFLLGHGLRCWWKNKWKKQHLDIILAQHDVKMYPACFEVVQVTLSHIQVTKNPKCPQCTSSALISLQKWRVKHGSFSRASLLSFQIINPSKTLPHCRKDHSSLLDGLIALQASHRSDMLLLLLFTSCGIQRNKSNLMIHYVPILRWENPHFPPSFHIDHAWPLEWNHLQNLHSGWFRSLDGARCLSILLSFRSIGIL